MAPLSYHVPAHCDAMPQQGRACQRLADTPGTQSSALLRPLVRRQCVGRGFGLGRGSLSLLNRKPQRCNIIATRFSFGTDGIFGTVGIRPLFAVWFNAASMIQAARSVGKGWVM